MATLDTMVMAGKGTHSEEPVPIVCPLCKNESIEQTCMGWGTPNRNRAVCHPCHYSGTVEDWLLIERLRRCVVGLSKGDRLEPLASQP